MLICGPPTESPVMLRLQARYSQLAWETLVEVQRTKDQKLIAQALLILVSGLVVGGFKTSAPFYLFKLCGVINKENLRFLPVYGRPPELSEEVREDVTVLSQAIYLENYFYLASGGAAPVMTARIEREFRLELQVCSKGFVGVRSRFNNLVQRVYPHLFSICPLTMRTQGILLVRDAIFVLSPPSADRKTGLGVLLRIRADLHHLISSSDVGKAGGLRESRHQLVLAMDNFCNDLMKNLQRFIEVKDAGGAGMIWTCCITCLGHLAALCHFISQTELTLRGAMDNMCKLALDRLANLSYEAHIEEFTHFDVLTGVCIITVLLQMGEALTKNTN